MRLMVLGLFSAVALLGASGCAHNQMRGASCATGNCQAVTSDCGTGNCGTDACGSCGTCAKRDWKAILFPCNRDCKSDCDDCGTCGIQGWRPLRGGRCGGLCDSGPAYSAYTAHGPRDFFATSPRPLGP